MGQVDDTALRAAVVQKSLELGDRLGDLFVERAQSYAPRGSFGDRGDAIFENIGHDPADVAGDMVVIRVYCTSGHARYNNEGTGIYGPEGEPITALHTLPNGEPGFLKFDSAIMGIVFTKEVAGYPGSHFWDRAIDDWPDIVAGLA